MTRHLLNFDSPAGPRELWAYGRKVWPAVRDEAVTWRSRSDGPALVRGRGEPEALWWAMLDGPFEASGGVVDLLYRAHVLSAFLDDTAGDIEASGVRGDAWLDVLRLVCATRSRSVRVTDRPVASANGDRRRVMRRAAMLARRTVGQVTARARRADLLFVLTHGHMAQRDSEGHLADRYTALLSPRVRTQVSTAVISLEPSSFGFASDVMDMSRHDFIPWTSFVSAAELLAYGREREAWRSELSQGPSLELTSGGADLSGVLRTRATILAARGLALARLYRRAFERIAERIAPRAILAVEGHSNVGRMIGLAMPATPLLAPQGGIIGPGGETNGAYDQRALTPLSPDRMRGCPVPTRALMWGEFYARSLRGLGHSPKRIGVSGLLRDAPRLLRVPRAVVYIAGANDDLFAFAYGLEEELLTIRLVRDAMDADMPMLLRLHPNHDPARYVGRLPNGVELSVGRVRSLSADLSEAALVVGKASTALIEAAVAGLPVLAVNFGPTPDIWAMGASGLPYVDDARELRQALAEAMARRPAMEDVVSCTGSDAVARLLDEVDRAVSG